MTVPLYNLTDTWNNGATVFTALLMNVTDSASDAASLLMDLQVGSKSSFNVRKDNLTRWFGAYTDASNYSALFISCSSTTALIAPDTIVSGSPGGTPPYLKICMERQSAAGGYITTDANNGIQFGQSSGTPTFWVDPSGVTLRQPADGTFGWTASTGQAIAALDLKLARDAAAILAQRNGVNAQTFRVYNTFTDASNYERGVFDWNATANVLTIGTQAAGTGTPRNVQIVSNQLILPGEVKMSLHPNFFRSDDDKYSFIVDRTNVEFNRPVIIGSNDGSAISLGFENNLTSVPDTNISRTAAGVLAFGNGTAGDSSACIVAKTKAGAPTTADVPAGTFALIRDTTNATTKLYYNNAGALQSVALT